jgi:hypothetical protein
MRTMDRKLSKMQSRVVLCTEQLRAVRKLSTETCQLATSTLSQHATTLLEVQEESNSLHRVLSSLQDVVVKQIEVRKTIARAFLFVVYHARLQFAHFERNFMSRRSTLTPLESNSLYLQMIGCVLSRCSQAGHMHLRVERVCKYAGDGTTNQRPQQARECTRGHL